MPRPKTFSYVLSLALVLLAIPALKAQSNRQVLDQDTGDLDGDGTPEKVEVIMTSTADTTIREVLIYGKYGDDWELWKRVSGGVLLPTDNTDPFVGVEIKEGQLLLHHLGGEQVRWTFTHHFELKQGGWFLSRAIMTYTRRCESVKTIDFDLALGTVAYLEETNKCEANAVNQELVNRNELLFIDKLPLLEGFVPGTNRMKIPGTTIEFFF